MHSTTSSFLDRKLDLLLNSFETKAAGFCKRSSQTFSPQENRMTVKLSTEWIQSNSIIIKASFFVKHWKNQTLNDRIMPPFWFFQSINISCLNSARRLCWCQVFRSCFSGAAREGNDRQTFDGDNSIKSKTTLVSEHRTYLTVSEWVTTYVVILKNRIKVEGGET